MIMLRSLLVMLAVWVPLIALGEWGAREWIETHGDALDITRSVLQADASIGWKQRANLDTEFLGFPLTTNEWGWRELARPFESNEQKVLVLGPSSAFGWGVAEEDTYARQLEAMLVDAERMQVINAGEIGYSVVQGARLFDDIRESGAKADIVVIAYGVNDLDRHRFYYDSPRTDIEEFAQPHSVFSAQLTDMLFSSALLNIGFKGLGALMPRASSDASDSDVRVPPSDFRATLAELVSDAQGTGARVILLTTAVVIPPDATLDARVEMERIERGVAEYNGIVREIGDIAGANVVDIDAAFGEEERHSLFVDPIHFSARGNELVARALASIIVGTSTAYGNGH